MLDCPIVTLTASQSDAMPHLKVTHVTRQNVCCISISQTLSCCSLYNAMLLGERTTWRPEKLMMHVRPAFQPSQHQLHNEQCDWSAYASDAYARDASYSSQSLQRMCYQP